MIKQSKTTKTILTAGAVASLGLGLSNTVQADETVTATNITEANTSKTSSPAEQGQDLNQAETRAETSTTTEAPSPSTEVSTSGEPTPATAEATEASPQEVALATAQADLTTATDTVNTLEDEVKADNSQVETALAEKTQAEKNLETAQAALDSVGDSKYPSQIKLTQDWLDNFKILRDSEEHHLINLNKPEVKQAFDKLNELGYLNDQQNPFTVAGQPYKYLKESEAIYDVNNLPEELKVRLNLYFAKLVNSIHEQLGDSERLVINKNLIEFANVTARNYEKLSEEDYKNQPNEWLGHSVTSINAGAESKGFGRYGLNVYENLHNYYGYGLRNKVSEDFLFEQVHSTVTGFFIRDKNSKYGHGLAIIKQAIQGIDFAWNDQLKRMTLSAISGPKQYYFGSYRDEYTSLYKEYKNLEETNHQKAQEVYRNETYVRLREERLNLLEQISQLSKKIPSRFSSEEPNYNYYKSLYDQRYELREQVKTLNEQISIYENEFYKLKGAEQYEPYEQKLEELREKISQEYELLYGVDSAYNIKEADQTKELEQTYRQAQEKLAQASQQYTAKLQDLTTSQEALKAAKAKQEQAQATLDKAKAELEKAQTKTPATKENHIEVQPTTPITEEKQTEGPLSSSVTPTVQPVETPKAETVKPIEAPKDETTKPAETSKAKTVKPVETPKDETTKPVEIPKVETTKPVEAPKTETTKSVTQTRHLAQTNPADYQKLVNKINQAMSKTSQTEPNQSVMATSTGKTLPNTGAKENSFLALLGMNLLGLVGLGRKKKSN